MEIYLAILLILVLSAVIATELNRSRKAVANLASMKKKFDSMNAKFAFLEESKSNFVSAASHQLREPLASTKGYVSLFLEGTFGKISPKLKGILEKVYISNERLIILIENLLDISHLEEGRMEFNFSKKNLNRIVKGSVENLTIQAKNKNIYLKFVPNKRKLPHLWVDKDKIREVMIDLIDNAVKYTRRGGVTVQIKRRGNKVLIITRDTGIGLKKREAAELFKKFSRCSESVKMNATGVGLALFTARKVVAAHKGEIYVESKGKGKGSTFTIELPLNLKKPPNKKYIQSALKVQKA